MLEKFDSHKLKYIPLNHNTGIANALNIGRQKIIDSKERVDYCLTMDQDSKFPLDRFDDVKKYLIENIEKNSIKKVKCWITSCNFIFIELYKKVKGFRSELFIDYVDFELNEQFFNHKINIGYIQDISLEHKIGNPIEKFFYEPKKMEKLRMIRRGKKDARKKIY